MKLKVVVFFLLILSVKHSQAQVKLSEILQESSIVQTKSNKLYFVDFWATWCGPCKYAKKILTVLQKQYPHDFHAISISYENPQLVEKFIKKNPTELTIATDYYSQTIKNYDIRSFPSGILFNAKGNVLWRGHPSDLKPAMLSNFLRQNPSKKSLREFVEIIEEDFMLDKDYEPSRDIEIINLNNDILEFEILTTEKYVHLKGQLSSILSELNQVYKAQINIDNKIDNNYEVFIKKPLQQNTNYGLKIIDQLGYSLTETKKKTAIISLKINTPNFWDINQIDWHGGTSNYLVSDSDITANNVSLKDMSFQLAKVLETPVVILFDDEAQINTNHDWQIHYKYFQLMENNFEDYGISVSKIKKEIPLYNIIKKAP